jgi:hypothetical protein
MSLGENERLLEITALQQQALALEAEVRHRKEADKALLKALDDQRQVEHTLRTTEKNLRSLLENAAEGIHWVDAKGVVVWANRAELEPNVTPIASASKAAAAGCQPLATSTAVKIDVKPTTAPTDKSMPPEKMTSVRPTAAIPRVALSVNNPVKTHGEKNPS